MLWRLGCLFVTVALAVGCQPPKEKTGGSEDSPPAVTAPEFSHVITTGSAYYTGGPQQGRPPDGTLFQGTRVRVLENAGSYSVVRTADGIEGYVSTAAIGPAESVKGEKK